MKFSEIANRLTGISTPFGGASWQPAELEIAGGGWPLSQLTTNAGAPDLSHLEIGVSAQASIWE